MSEEKECVKAVISLETETWGAYGPGLAEGTGQLQELCSVVEL